jgi:hypothetical protein
MDHVTSTLLEKADLPNAKKKRSANTCNSDECSEKTLGKQKQKE